MRCNICDTRLSEDEINFEKDHGNYAPCRTCIDLSGTTKFAPTDIEVLERLLQPEGTNEQADPIR